MKNKNKLNLNCSSLTKFIVKRLIKVYTKNSKIKQKLLF